MKKLLVLTMLTLMVMPAATGHAFIDYLFGGSHSRNAIDNSAVGDLRAWWTGNPVYQFNPYYSGGNNPAQQAAGRSMGMQQPTGMQQSTVMQQPAGVQQGYQPQPQANVTYFPQQAQQPYGYGTPQPQQTYGGQPIYGSAGASLPLQGSPQTYQQPQQYQQMPQQYQQMPQQYQQMPQQYQQMPQQYQQAAPQQYQQPAPQGYR